MGGGGRGGGCREDDEDPEVVAAKKAEKAAAKKAAEEARQKLRELPEAKLKLKDVDLNDQRLNVKSAHEAHIHRVRGSIVGEVAEASMARMYLQVGSRSFCGGLHGRPLKLASPLTCVRVTQCNSTRRHPSKL